MTAVDEIPEPRTVRAADGSLTGYYEFGDPRGRPVIAMHGTPNCGAGFAWADAPARERGLRVLAPDRPGVGDSDPWRVDRAVSVADYAGPLRAFADALQLDSFFVLGYSGGGPYALAVAHALSDRVLAAAVVSGAGEVGGWATIGDFDPTDEWLTRLALHAPPFARATLAVSARFARLAPKLSMRFAKLGMGATDLAVMDEFADAPTAVTVFTASCRRTARGVVDDYAALGRPWGFDLGEITVPVRCWHAPTDPLVPVAHSEEVVRRVRGAELEQWPGEGHLAIVRHVGEVLDWLGANGLP
jgi:pimeloyl-ACP methyl ester carboxylesterase